MQGQSLHAFSPVLDAVSPQQGAVLGAHCPEVAEQAADRESGQVHNKPMGALGGRHRA